MSWKRKKISRKELIYGVALAGVSAAIATMFIWLSVVVKLTTIAFFVAASVAVMIPTTKKYYIASVFAYVVSAGLSVAIAGDIYNVIGYIVYFGPMAIISGILRNRNVKWYIELPVKVAYINGALALLYFAFGNVLLDVSILSKLPYVALAAIGTVVLLAVDYVVRLVYAKVAPVIEKVLRKKLKTPIDRVVSFYDEDFEDSSDCEPFDEFDDEPNKDNENAFEDDGDLHAESSLKKDGIFYGENPFEDDEDK